MLLQDFIFCPGYTSAAFGHFSKKVPLLSVIVGCDYVGRKDVLDKKLFLWPAIIRSIGKKDCSVAQT